MFGMIVFFSLQSIWNHLKNLLVEDVALSFLMLFSKINLFIIRLPFQRRLCCKVTCFLETNWIQNDFDKHTVSTVYFSIPSTINSYGLPDSVIASLMMKLLMNFSHFVRRSLYFKILTHSNFLTL